MLKKFSIFVTSHELEAIETMARNSEMEYNRTEKLSTLERLILGIPADAPEIYAVVVEGTEYQFEKLVKKAGDLTRLF